jgi:hypothetical protein
MLRAGEGVFDREDAAAGVTEEEEVVTIEPGGLLAPARDRR